MLRQWGEHYQESPNVQYRLVIDYSYQYSAKYKYVTVFIFLNLTFLMRDLSRNDGKETAILIFAIRIEALR